MMLAQLGLGCCVYDNQKWSTKKGAIGGSRWTRSVTGEIDDLQAMVGTGMGLRRPLHYPHRITLYAEFQQVLLYQAAPPLWLVLAVDGSRAPGEHQLAAGFSLEPWTAYEK